MATTTQPTIRPTNKLTAATIAAAAVSISGVFVRNVWPSWYDAETWATLLPLAVFAVGYLVKDAPNQ
ncbi:MULTISPECIES: hypothetical protein [unclassified Mesorhizobium]|uniref:hypothetical protein n=1 Tax=unclassified Mesorhizobium TaxID=325217 RepID=UPI00112766EA|nr:MULTISPECIES: hypothetical protein [unclassified Mesorhizobium]TPJ48915.1 hypothetical protein FJ437_06415 [Mesorhizobium sp. B2-6-6]MBZ9897997.1 hypothetical protein [Mesorhizobium sp. BR1-1-6]MBZ9920095.1 hypothetical protein [Mesorhizobium sp. BR1-1-7]MBZ9955095.1 hypothetical protein [Mesorhizobium sp. BR1-1-15]MBZ9960860.1 hypothetical protein [Mesorhizobium sp. BR1-1-14]